MQSSHKCQYVVISEDPPSGWKFAFGNAGSDLGEGAPTAVLGAPRVTEILLEPSPPELVDSLKEATRNAALAEKLESFQAQIAALHQQPDNPEESLTSHPGTAWSLYWLEDFINTWLTALYGPSCCYRCSRIEILGLAVFQLAVCL